MYSTQYDAKDMCKVHLLHILVSTGHINARYTHTMLYLVHEAMVTKDVPHDNNLQLNERKLLSFKWARLKFLEFCLWEALLSVLINVFENLYFLCGSGHFNKNFLYNFSKKYNFFEISKLSFIKGNSKIRINN